MDSQLMFSMKGDNDEDVEPMEENQGRKEVLKKGKKNIFDQEHQELPGQNIESIFFPSPVQKNSV